MKYPSHIVELAISWAQGKPVRDMLFDALVESELLNEHEIKELKYHFWDSPGGACKPGKTCYFVTDILNDAKITWECKDSDAGTKTFTKCGNYLEVGNEDKA